MQGGTSATYNMNVSSDGDQLFYENFIYIAFKATFTPSSPDDLTFGVPSHSGHAIIGIPWTSTGAATQGNELVLEVQLNNNKIVLRSKVARTT